MVFVMLQAQSLKDPASGLQAQLTATELTATKQTAAHAYDMKLLRHDVSKAQNAAQQAQAVRLSLRVHHSGRFVMISITSENCNAHVGSRMLVLYVHM